MGEVSRLAEGFAKARKKNDKSKKKGGSAGGRGKVVKAGASKGKGANAKSTGKSTNQKSKSKGKSAKTTKSAKGKSKATKTKSSSIDDAAALLPSVPFDMQSNEIWGNGSFESLDFDLHDLLPLEMVGGTGFTPGRGTYMFRNTPQ